MDQCPLVSVLMAVYNGEIFLEESIESILDQTYRNIEFIIVNDQSTDKSGETLKNYELKDKRVRVLESVDKGLVSSLNLGLMHVKGEFVARFDCDDISEPDRIQSQVDFFLSNEGFDIVGGHYRKIDKNGAPKGQIINPLLQDHILFNLFYSVPFANPSVMVRRSVFDSLKYDECYVEDYLFFSKAFTGYNFANLDKILISYRHQYQGSFSDIKRVHMINAEKAITRSLYEKYGDMFWQRAVQSSPNKFLARALVAIYLVGFRKSVIKFLCNNVKHFPSFGFYACRHASRVLYWKLMSS